MIACLLPATHIYSAWSDKCTCLIIKLPFGNAVIRPPFACIFLEIAATTASALDALFKLCSIEADELELDGGGCKNCCSCKWLSADRLESDKSVDWGISNSLSTNGV